MPSVYADTSFLQFKKVHCRNCYKCVRNCPVKAIRVINHQAQILEDQCILCEKCTLVCPQNAKEELNMIPRVHDFIQSGGQVIASLHPAYVAEFGTDSLPALTEALKKLGLSDAFDAAAGAYLVKTAYENLVEERAQETPTISSNCPVIVQLVQKRYPDLVPYLAPVLSVMQAHARYLKEQYPDARILSVSPCISGLAQMREADNYVDYVITFSELQEWLTAVQVQVAAPSNASPDADRDIRLSRIMAMSGGFTMAMHPSVHQRYLPACGIDSCKQILNEFMADPDSYSNCFLELNACPNGCIGGPSFRRTKTGLLHGLIRLQNASLYKGISNYKRDDFSAQSLTDVSRHYDTFVLRQQEAEASEEDIKKVLAQMGKFTPEDELNCGACGYNTCREKARAVLAGKAEISMCVPFMRERQESYSNKIINVMPGILVTVDYQLKVIHMNQAARDLFDPLHKKELIGAPVSDLMDDYSLVNLISFDKNRSDDQIYLEDRKIYLERTLANDRKNQLILCVMKDITREMEEKLRIRKARNNAAAMADKLAAEQLKLVHQIASLLGETAADTKVAVEQLKRTILREDEDFDE